MSLTQHEAVPQEPRYDTETLKKVTVLAQRLQDGQQDTLTLRDMERIGGEVGLAPQFIRKALAQVVPRIATPRPAPSKAFLAAWWSAGWVLPLLLTLAAGGERGPDGFLGGLLFFLGWGIYIGGGVFFSVRFSEEEKARELAAGDGTGPQKQLSRAVLLDALFALQSGLEAQKVRRAFLSIDVVGSTEMKSGAPELMVETSFGQFRSLVDGVTRGCGGEMQSHAGDGMMCVFPDAASAVRAARALQEALPAFNREKNRLPAPFRVRCGVSAGEVALDDGMPLGHVYSPVIDRAAVLQKQAAPGDIVVDAESAAAALTELGPIAPLPAPVAGQPAFSWLAANKQSVA